MTISWAAPFSSWHKPLHAVDVECSKNGPAMSNCAQPAFRPVCLSQVTRGETGLILRRHTKRAALQCEVTLIAIYVQAPAPAQVIRFELRPPHALSDTPLSGACILRDLRQRRGTSKMPAKPLKSIKPMFLRDKWKILRGDLVQIISGKDKDAQGVVLRVDRNKRRPRVFVQGLNLVRTSGGLARACCSQAVAWRCI